MSYANHGKRLLDLLVAVSALLILFPLMCIASLAIAIEDGRPVFFFQERVGRRNQLFTIYKFRSMKRDTGDMPSIDAAREAVTRVGKFLRRTNIDELPQLVSVLRGDMSVVGPRPALPTQHRLLKNRSESGAADLRPGLTGLAQINAFDGMSEDEKANWDARYASDIGLTTDIAILFRTIGYLFRRPPVY